MQLLAIAGAVSLVVGLCGVLYAVLHIERDPNAPVVLFAAMAVCGWLALAPLAFSNSQSAKAEFQKSTSQ